MKKIIINILVYPKKLFLVDGAGALLSAFLLGIVLVQYEDVFGIPIKILHFLALLPCFFLVYDLLCYFFVNKNLDYFLKIIAVLNFLYCLISIGLISYHYQQITDLGWAYIFCEIIIILILVIAELKAATRFKMKKSRRNRL
ncbi:hypothetical protein [Aquimarina sp. 2201CG5-10]|uniref:hypothetical protein n=1 Tax=Aquimarina callyspongiae TaxID=3098150 RepID=UPI002AB3C235|nr:hypothetical protein [Aquimarina sp. 2201CG5-10]MDY8135658.1 hypothetical protein [Aquimarina sp. 2201CG5-10]